ncbi:hypothetical protein TNCV_3756341 [Trichonephila clavipes]|nr:hypothetical protein TNCV_3756341 [Trichonephila clavipes]
MMHGLGMHGKCIVPLRHWGTQKSYQAVSPLVRLEEGEESYKKLLITVSQPPGQPIGVNVHCTQHPIREQSLSSQPSQKTQKLSTQMKNHSHASRIPSLDQSPSCHSAEWKTPLLPCPAS